MRIINYIIFLTAFHLISTSCSGEKENNAQKQLAIKPVVSNTNQTTKNEQIFKSWLIDTLGNLNDWENIKELYVIKNELIVDSDSFSLQLNSYYSTKINNRNKYEGEILNILNLLKEYDELPKQEFILSFNFQMFYYPSDIERFKYNFIYEINDLMLIEVDKTTKYSYNRGRLTNKEEAFREKNGKERIIKTNFIWNGEMLEKKILNK